VFFCRTILGKDTRQKPYKMRQRDEFSAIFERLSPPFLAIYYAFAFLFEEKFSQICIRNCKKMEFNS